LPTRAEEVGVDLTLTWQGGGPQIAKETDRIEATLSAQEVAALPHPKGADWLSKAHVSGPRYELQLWLQRPAAPQWAQAVRRYLAAGSLLCEQREEQDGCVSSHWSYKPPAESAGPEDACLRRQVLGWAIAHMPPADLRAAMPALVPQVRDGAMDMEA